MEGGGEDTECGSKNVVVGSEYTIAAAHTLGLWWYQVLLCCVQLVCDTCPLCQLRLVPFAAEEAGSSRHEGMGLW